jgi:indole-3-glycerol phosphate synthase
MSSSPPSVLEAILRSTREELERRKRVLSPQALEARLSSLEASHGDRPGRSLASALGAPGMAVIAEFKRRSPSAGSLRASADVGEIIVAYERGGAAALSVLTEGPNFGGSLEDLRVARGACELPILRKDFIVDPYQLHEALLAGADAVLLIVAALEQEELATLHRSAGELGLDVLVEVHDQRELHSALSLDAKLIGINNRDLRDFSVDVGRTAALVGEVPPGVAVVSESGIRRSEQLRELESEGVSAVLVGESLMRASDPEAALRALMPGGDGEPRAADIRSARI